MKAGSRKPEFEIEPLILSRWSSRCLSGEAMTRDELAPLFEAARWAPSSGNLQPWRFVYVLPGSARWAELVDILAEGNRWWASKAGALLLLVSRRLLPNRHTGEMQLQVSHSFDAGAAWVCLAQQASASGLVAHAMGGFDRARATAFLGLDERYQVEVVIAVGKPGDPANLTDEQRERDVPNGRRPQAEWVFKDSFVPDAG